MNIWEALSNEERQQLETAHRVAVFAIHQATTDLGERLTRAKDALLDTRNQNCPLVQDAPAVDLIVTRLAALRFLKEELNNAFSINTKGPLGRRGQTVLGGYTPLGVDADRQRAALTMPDLEFLFRAIKREVERIMVSVTPKIATLETAEKLA